MLTKQSLARIAAASVAGLVVAMGSTGPAQADPKHDAHGSSGAAAGSSERAHPAAHRHAAHEESSKGATPRRHSPVTVCHLLGNGSYILLTFDRRALDAHQAHGDLYPVPAGGCPAAAADNTAGPTASAMTTETIDESTTAGPVAPMAARPAIVDGVELARTPAELAGYRTPAPSAVLGTEALAGASTGSMTSAPSAGTQTASDPSAGVLPQTGAAPIAGALLTGLGLLAAGAVLLRRRTRTNA